MSYDFITHARLHGVNIDRLDDSGNIKRCGTEEHPSSKNGAYMFDGERGWVQAWDGDCEIHWWDDPNRSAPTQYQREEWAKKKAARIIEQARLWGKAAEKAAVMLDTAVSKEHNYLHRKGLGDVLGMVLPEGQLFVPMRNMKTHLVGGQLIYWREDIRAWEKKYLYGMRSTGGGRW